MKSGGFGVIYYLQITSNKMEEEVVVKLNTLIFFVYYHITRVISFI